MMFNNAYHEFLLNWLERFCAIFIFLRILDEWSFVVST